MSNDKAQTPMEWLSEKVLHLDWQFLTQEKKRQILEQTIDRENIAKQEAYNQGFAKAKSIYLDAE